MQVIKKSKNKKVHIIKILSLKLINVTHWNEIMSDNESFTKKKLLKAKFSEEDSFMRVKVKANCDFVFAARWKFSYTPFAKGAIVDNKRMSLFF
jgi:hypothetical protein